MSEAKPTTSTTRRGLLAGSTLAAVLACSEGAVFASAPPAAIDAELLAIDREAVPLIAEFDRYVGMFFALEAGSPDLERVGSLADPSSHRLDELTGQAIDLKASTLGGCVAKARLLQHEMLMHHGIEGVFDTFPEQVEERLAWSLVNDLLALGGRA